MKNKKILKVIFNCLFGIATVFLLVILFLAFINRNDKLPKIGDYSILVVQGDSMHPKIKDGDLISINRKKKKGYSKGDIVSFVNDDGSYVTHTIIDVEESDGEYKYFTKGINNTYQDNDYVKIEQIIGEYKGFRIPLLGYVVGFANSTIGYLILVILPLIVVFIIALKEIIKEIYKKRGEI